MILIRTFGQFQRARQQDISVLYRLKSLNENIKASVKMVRQTKRPQNRKREIIIKT